MLSIRIGVMIGSIKIIIVVMVNSVNAFITFIWSCTKFLVPKTNGLLLSYKSKKAIFYEWVQELAVLALIFLGG